MDEMKKNLFSFFLSLVVSFVMVAVLLPQVSYAATADESSGPWADSVFDYSPGDQKNGSPVSSDRQDSTQALGPAETTGSEYDTFSGIPFVSLGFGGEITLEFENSIVNEDGPDLMIYEVTGGRSYPDEMIKVEVSVDGFDWTTLADSATRDAELDLGDLSCVHYVRLTDVSYPDDFNSTADGYDVDAVKALNWSPDACELDDELIPWEGDIRSQGYWKNHDAEYEELNEFELGAKPKGDKCKIYGTQLVAFVNNWESNPEYDEVSFQDAIFDSMGEYSEYDGWIISDVYDEATSFSYEECSGFTKNTEFTVNDLMMLKNVLDDINNGMYVWY